MSHSRSNNDFKRANLKKRLNITVQIILSLSLLLAINYLGSHYYERTDLTESRKHSLSPETKAYLKTVEAPIEIYVVLPEIESDEHTMRLLRDLRRLLGKFEHYISQEGNNNLTVEFIDVYRERNRAREILGRYGISSQSSILITSGNRMKQISLDAIYEMKDDKIHAFRGESIFLSAMLQIAESTERKIYFLTGQGEADLESVDPVTGLSSLRSFLRERGMVLQTLELPSVNRIPEDAAAVVIASPTSQYREREVSLLRNYLAQENGSILAFLDAGSATGLETLAQEWGMRIDNRTVVDVGSDYQSATGDLIIRSYGEHPVTNFLENLDVTVLTGLPRPILKAVDDAVDPSTLKVTSLLQSSNQSWVESDEELGPGTTVTFNPEEDLPGPVSIAAAAERRSDAGLELDISATRGGRFVIIGDADFATNARLNAFGNRLLFLSALNWCLNSSNQLTIPPRQVDSYLIVLSQNELRNLLLWLMTLPAALALIGILVSILRR